MSGFTRLALIIALVAFSEGALAYDHASGRCLHHMRPVRVVSPNSGHIQWAYAAGVYMMDPQTGLLYGDQEAVSRFDPNSDGIDLFVHGDKGCSSTLASAELLSVGWRPVRSSTGQMVFERTPVGFRGAPVPQGALDPAQL